MSANFSNKSLRYAIYDGIAWALMIGFGETFLSAYAIFLNADPTVLALLAAFPAFIQAFSQIIGLKLLDFFPSRRKLSTVATILQAFSWLPLASLGLFLSENTQAPYYLLILAGTYFFLGSLSGPAWNSLIGDLVPSDGRGAYFGLRNRKMSYATLAALVLAGPLLGIFQRIDQTAWGFALLFVLAAVCRVVSAYWLSKYDDPPAEKSPNAYFSFLDFLKRTPYSNFTKFVVFFSLFNFGYSICSPFFSLFVLKELHLSYAQFTILSGCMISAQILTLQQWGKLSDRFGNKAILFIAAPGASCGPLLWMISHNFAWLIFIHLFSGFVWAGFNLSAANFLFDAVTPAKRGRCVAYQSIVNGCAMLFGSFLGSYLLKHPIERLHPIFPNLGVQIDYYVVFLASFTVRASVVFYFWKVIKEVREVEAISRKDLIFRVVQVKALAGLLFAFDSKKTRRKRNSLHKIESSQDSNLD